MRIASCGLMVSAIARSNAPAASHLRWKKHQTAMVLKLTAIIAELAKAIPTSQFASTMHARSNAIPGAARAPSRVIRIAAMKRDITKAVIHNVLASGHGIIANGAQTKNVGGK